MWRLMFPLAQGDAHLRLTGRKRRGQMTLLCFAVLFSSRYLGNLVGRGIGPASEEAQMRGVRLTRGSGVPAIFIS